MEISRRHPSFPRISSAELVIMKVVWEKAPVTANTVVAALQKQQHWKPKTIQTLLSRLVRKGVLTFEKKGREYHFRPRVEAAEYRHAASRSFPERKPKTHPALPQPPGPKRCPALQKKRARVSFSPAGRGSRVPSCRQPLFS